MEYVVAFLCLAVFLLGVAIWELWKQVNELEAKVALVDTNTFSQLSTHHDILLSVYKDVAKLKEEHHDIEIAGTLAEDGSQGNPFQWSLLP